MFYPKLLNGQQRTRIVAAYKFYQAKAEQVTWEELKTATSKMFEAKLQEDTDGYLKMKQAAIVAAELVVGQAQKVYVNLVKETDKFKAKKQKEAVLQKAKQSVRSLGFGTRAQKIGRGDF